LTAANLPRVQLQARVLHLPHGQSRLSLSNMSINGFSPAVRWPHLLLRKNIEESQANVLLAAAGIVFCDKRQRFGQRNHGPDHAVMGPARRTKQLVCSWPERLAPQIPGIYRGCVAADPNWPADTQREVTGNGRGLITPVERSGKEVNKRHVYPVTGAAEDSNAGSKSEIMLRLSEDG
jgi:hypothetical protein